MAYSGTGLTREKVKKANGLDGVSLVWWFCSHFISLLPLYISIIKWSGEGKTLNVDFWKKCFLREDILWVFSTILLFSLTDAILKNHRENRSLCRYLIPIGLLVFLLIETTWIVFDYILPSSIGGLWPLYLGIFLSILSILVSTPLKISYMKEEN